MNFRRSKKEKWSFLFVLFVTFLVLSTNISIDKNVSSGQYKVIRVVDGDTIVLDIDGRQEDVRLLGIDAPETDSIYSEGECFGEEAVQKVKKELIGRIVTFEIDGTQDEKDKYGRLLGYVFIDGINLSHIMIGEGYAREYTHIYPYKYQEEFKNAEKDAKLNERGLWKECSN